MSHNNRNTICVEIAEVVAHTAYPFDQFVLRLMAPECARRAKAGSFIHIQCHVDIPMRRPISIMRVDSEKGWIEILYKIVGVGLQALSRLAKGDQVNILGPIGNGFSPDQARPRTILIGGGVGIPPLIFLADDLRHDINHSWHPIAFLGSEVPFPFELHGTPTRIQGIPESASTALSLLEHWSVPSRLASRANYPGCYPGWVTELTRQFLQSCTAEQLDQTMVFACGPGPMLEAACKLAQEFNLPSQLCLEEFMACAVGGCAGCTVQFLTEDGPAMKRVCVDGPVFPGDSIYPPAL